jgi:hypothetical protein
MWLSVASGLGISLGIVLRFTSAGRSSGLPTRAPELTSLSAPTRERPMRWCGVTSAC